MIKYTDQEIVDQLKRGNTRVFKALYADFKKVTGFITQNSGSEEDAKDFFHEALIVLYEKIINNDFELKSKLSTYLFSICKNLWLYHLRDKKPIIFNNINKTENDLSLAENPIEKQEDIIQQNEKIALIMKKIDELKEPCYSILMLFYFKKMDYKAIAQKLNYKTEKVVKNQKYRCLQKIKESLPDTILDMY